MQSILRHLRRTACGLWFPDDARYGIEAGIDDRRKRAAIEARTAVFHAGYGAGADYTDIAVAFGWRGTGRADYYRDHVTRRHDAMMDAAVRYAERYGMLAMAPTVSAATMLYREVA